MRTGYGLRVAVAPGVCGCGASLKTDFLRHTHHARRLQPRVTLRYVGAVLQGRPDSTSNMSPMSGHDAPVRAPELTGAVDWLNVDAPLTLAGLRGKVVLLDFWTYGCVNCMHLLPGLARLEAKYGDVLVVIGVHSAKFTNERGSDNIQRILERYGITHPVANDAELRVWREYTVRAWPTLVLIDPAGYIVAGGSGEGHIDAFDEAIAAVV